MLLRFLSELDQPGLTPEDLRRSGAALALQILSISAAAIGFVTYTSLRTRRYFWAPKFCPTKVVTEIPSAPMIIQNRPSTLP